MTQTVHEFADLNDYGIDKAERIVRDWAENSDNPGLKNLARTWLENSDL